MAKLTTTCRVCGTSLAFREELRGQQRGCPNCGAAITLEPDAPPPGAAPPAAAAGGSEFPERMKANKALAGKMCPGCAKEIELGDDVHNCQACGATSHQACHEQSPGCANPQCPNSRAGAALAPAAAGSAAAEDEVECKYCGEFIKSKAKKCRFCGEFQSGAGTRRPRRGPVSDASNDNLTVAEIIFGILCGGIACIVGLVWAIQGKKKGGKLMVIAIISQIIFTIINLAAQNNMR
jgi:hypothetical protein